VDDTVEQDKKSSTRKRARQKSQVNRKELFLTSAR